MTALPVDPVSIPRKASSPSSSSDPSPRTASSFPSSPHSTPREERTDSLFSSQQASPSSRRSSVSKSTPPQSPTNGSLADYERRRSSTLGSMLDKLRLSSSSSSPTISRASVQTAASSSPGSNSSLENKKKRQGSMRGIPKELDHLRQEMISPTFELLKKDGFKLLSFAAIESMQPQERCLLQKKLQDEKAQNPGSFELIDHCLQLIMKFQENLRNRKLLSLIINKTTFADIVADAKEEVKADSIWEPLLLASESIISPDELFRLIHQEITLPPKQSSPRDPIVWLQLFCEHWLKANMGTASVRKAEKPLRAIIEFAKTSLPSTPQNRWERIHKALQEALLPLPERKSLALEKDKECRPFSILTDEILQGKFKSAKYVAEDLRQYQIMLYCQMTPSLLINAKWNVAPDEFTHMIALSNNLAAYIVDRVISAQNLEASVFYIRYFLEVARYAMESRDFATVHSIVSALSNGFITQLRVWPLVFKASGCRDFYENLECNLFSPINNHKPLRLEMERMLKEKQSLYLPSWSPLAKDMTFINENRPLDTSDDKDPDYNYSKLLMIYTSLRPFFLPQERWIAHQRGKTQYKFQTDLVHTCLKYRESNELDRKAMVVNLAPSRNSSSGSAKP